jgi:hypothetical protein
VTRLIGLQVALNERYAHQRIEFNPTLSPINLLPSANSINQAVGWGREQVSAEIPRLKRFFERVRWTPPENSV